MKQDRVLITGASSGIGEGLACALARPGATLVLIGLDTPRLDRVAAACRAKGAAVSAHPVDVTDGGAMALLLAGAAPLDLVFANAGVAYGTAKHGLEPACQVRRTLSVNIDGVMNTVLPALDMLLRQAPGPDGVRGRIVVTASVAAFLAYPNSPSYCASKAAIDIWTVATAANVAARGVLMTSICPGFVRTRMTECNDFPMPGLMEIEPAIRRILRGVTRGQRRVVFPGWIGCGSRLVALLPTRAREAILRRQPSKAPAPM